MNGGKPVLTPQEQMRLVYKYTTGSSIKALAEEFHIHQRTVKKYIHGDFKDRRYQFPKDNDCEAGLHSWIHARHKLRPDEKCTLCGEPYGNPS